jgi:hypothetical protein
VEPPSGRLSMPVTDKIHSVPKHTYTKCLGYINKKIILRIGSID